MAQKPERTETLSNEILHRDALVAAHSKNSASGRHLPAGAGMKGSRCFLGCVFIVSALIFVFFVSAPADAKVKGRCKDCHAMHARKPSPILMKGGCVECHGLKPEGRQNIITIGKARIPQIIHRMEDGDLASGNFSYVADIFNPEFDYGRGHNLPGISRAEDPPMGSPPGFEPSIPIPGGNGPVQWPVRQQMSCSGTWGCHGDRNIADSAKALSGAHHEDDRVIDGTTVGRSFRFLNGVLGVEHPDWEYLATRDNHNGYRGSLDNTSMDTVSYLCGQCHTKFHPNPYLGGAGEVGSAYYTLWVRHPADIAFGAMNRPYAGSEYQDFTRYSLEVPVAYEKPTGRETTVDIDSIVICMSCHRAHASPYPDTLRWNYNTEPGTFMGEGLQGTGCMTCHTRKGH